MPSGNGASPSQTIWVDADACPKVIKDILYRAAERTERKLILVANMPLRVPDSLFISSVRVSAGFDEADYYIAEKMAEGDLVITADIPLAAEVIERRGSALNPRGEFYDRENIGERLAVRDFMDQMRGSGVDSSSGPPPLTNQDRQVFANALDRFLAAWRTPR